MVIFGYLTEVYGACGAGVPPAPKRLVPQLSRECAMTTLLVPAGLEGFPLYVDAAGITTLATPSAKEEGVK